MPNAKKYIGKRVSLKELQENFNDALIVCSDIEIKIGRENETDYVTVIPRWISSDGTSK